MASGRRTQRDMPGGARLCKGRRSMVRLGQEGREKDLSWPVIFDEASGPDLVKAVILDQFSEEAE